MIGKSLRTSTNGLRNWGEVLERIQSELVGFRDSPGYKALLDTIDFHVSHLSRSIAGAEPMSKDVHALHMMLRFWVEFRDTLDEWTVSEPPDQEDVQGEIDDFYLQRDEALEALSNAEPKEPEITDDLWDSLFFADRPST